MSNRTIHNNHNKVSQNADNRMAESFGHPLSTNTASLTLPKLDVAVQPQSIVPTPAVSKPASIPPTTPQHQHFVNIPVQQPAATNTTVNILQQLNLPPLPALPSTAPLILPAGIPLVPPPPAAFQGAVLPTSNTTATPMATNMMTNSNLNMQMQARLNPAAPIFTPKPCTSIPMETSKAQTESTGLVQGSTPQTPGNVTVSSQIEQLKQKVQESLNKLQFLSLQLNTLQMVNQHNQTLQTLQQYQTVYQQYQIELANTVLLNQYIASLNQMASLQQLQTELQQQQQQQVKPDAVTSTINAVQSPSPQPAGANVNKLETIEEGEEEEMVDGDDIAAPAPVSNGDEQQQSGDQEDEGNEEMKEDEIETNTSSAIGEAVEISRGNFLKFPTLDTETNTNGTIEIGERTVNLNKSPSDLAKIKKQIRGILNKITPENFDKLSQEISSILKLADIAEQHNKENREPLSDEQLRAAQKAQFKALIRLILKCILEKAIIEPLFSNQYARLCYSLYLYAESNEMKKKVFRLQLISLCHGVFNRARNSAESARFIGIITIIGELFIYGLMSWRVINAGIFEELLPPSQALDIEAVCKLLKTSGHEFDKHHYEEINHVIESLSKYAQNFDFRTQCFVKELIEMRKNDWKQRKDIKPESPKPLSQIHREFHQEQAARKQVPASSNSPSSSYRSLPRNQHQHQMENNSSSFGRPQRYVNGNAYSQQPQYHGGARSNNYNGAMGGGQRWKNGYNSSSSSSSRYYGNNGNSYGGHSNSYHRYNHNGYPQRKRSKSLRPTVEFVKDVTLPDRSHYPANKLLTKTWAMRNSGELPWGDDVELVYFKGDESLSLQSRYPVMNAAPGQEVQLSANIRTPRTPGRYCTYFRLQKNGKFFGPRVWVDIIVADPNAAQQADGDREITKNCAVSSSQQHHGSNHRQPGVQVQCQ